MADVRLAVVEELTQQRPQERMLLEVERHHQGPLESLSPLVVLRMGLNLRSFLPAVVPQPPSEVPDFGYSTG